MHVSSMHATYYGLGRQVKRQVGRIILPKLTLILKLFAAMLIYFNCAHVFLLSALKLIVIVTEIYWITLIPVVYI